MFPYTDVNSTYDCEEAAGNLLDGTGNPLTRNLGPSGAPGSVADGFVGKGRGIIGETIFFNRGVEEDDQYDVNGLVSMSMIVWVRVSSLDQSPIAWSAYGTAAANRQAWQLNANQAGGVGNQVPEFAMYDGLTLNNSLRIKVSETAPDMTIDVWHMIGGSYNHVTNRIACFWGDGNDPSGATTYYAEADGFSAGFGFLHDFGEVWAGAWRVGGSAGNFIDIDHASYWKGRAHDENSFLDHWQLGTGLLVSEFGSDPGRRGGHFSELKELIARPRTVMHIADIRETLRMIYGEGDE